MNRNLTLSPKEIRCLQRILGNFYDSLVEELDAKGADELMAKIIRAALRASEGEE